VRRTRIAGKHRICFDGAGGSSRQWPPEHREEIWGARFDVSAAVAILHLYSFRSSWGSRQTLLERTCTIQDRIALYHHGALEEGLERAAPATGRLTNGSIIVSFRRVSREISPQGLKTTGPGWDCLLDDHRGATLSVRRNAGAVQRWEQ
jgi:hypothetical protein